MAVQERHVTVMFSGGTDSTLAAARMILEHGFERLTLLTLDPGYLFFLDNTRVHARALEDHFGRDRVRHVILPSRDAAKGVLFAEVYRDLARYGANMAALVCLGCRLSMHAAAIAFNLTERIPFIADGSVAIQNAIPEQMASTLARNRAFYFERFGIWQQSPIYDEAASDKALEALGIARQTRLKKQFVLFDTQYTCPFGVPADVYARLVYKPLLAKTRDDDSARYSAEKFPRVERWVEGKLAADGVSIGDAIAELKAFHARRGTGS